MCSLAICMSAEEKCLFNLAILNGVCVFVVESRALTFILKEREARKVLQHRSNGVTWVAA